jgi:hypothetical protein
MTIIVVHQAGIIPVQHALIQYVLNQPPSVRFKTKPHTYTPLSPGMLLQVKSSIAEHAFLNSSWIIETIEFNGSAQIIHVMHPIKSLDYEWSAQPYYQTSALPLLKNLLSPLRITLQHEGSCQALLEKRDFLFKHQTESSFNFFNWLCAFTQVHWACQLNNHIIQLVDTKRIETTPPHQLRQDTQFFHFFNKKKQIEAKIIQCAWLKKASFPCLLLQISPSSIELGQTVDCNYHALNFASIVQSINFELTWKNQTLGSITQTLGLSPFTECSLPVAQAGHPALMEAIAEGYSEPTLDHKGKQSIRLLIDETSQSFDRQKSPVETITPFSHPASAFQTPIPALNHVLVLGALQRQTNYLLGGLYQANMPSPQALTPNISQLSFPKNYSLNVEQADQQALTLQDTAHGLSLKLSYQPHLHCHLKNSCQSIQFLSNQYYCAAQSSSVLQAHRITWAGENVHLGTKHYNSYARNQIHVISNAFYQSASQHHFLISNLYAQSQQFKTQKETWNLMSKGSLKIKSNQSLVVEAGETMLFSTPSSSIALSAHEINISSTAIDFSSCLLTIAGKTCFNQKKKSEKKKTHFNTNEKNTPFTNSEKVSYDEKNTSLIDAFAFYQ